MPRRPWPASGSTTVSVPLELRVVSSVTLPVEVPVIVGASVAPVTVKVRVAVPVAWPGVVSGMVLTFAHSVGEFGVALMVGGSIPGVTRTLSITLYEDVQAMRYERALTTALGLMLLAFTALGVVALLQRRRGE